MVRPAFAATAEQRRDVVRLKAAGRSDERIAASLGIARNTLLVHFADELEHGGDIKLERLLEYAWRSARKGNAGAFRWLGNRMDKARAGEGGH